MKRNLNMSNVRRLRGEGRLRLGYIAALLAAALISVPAVTAYPGVLAAQTESTEEEPEETPSPQPEEEEETPAPSEAPVEDANPEESKEEMGIAVSGEAGASGGLGFLGSKFPDCRGHWAEEIINECADKKYLDGYEDGNFHPDASVTLSEFAKIFSGMRGSFYQITEGYWSTPYIITMLNSGIFEKGEYKDYNMPMTREMVAKAVIRSVKNENFPPDLSVYAQLIPDLSDAGAEYEEYVVKAYIAGIITGYEDNSIRPKAEVTRAEVLSILKRTLNKELRTIPELAELYGGGGSDTVKLFADTAKVEGGMLNIFGTDDSSYLENFRQNQKATFTFKADKGGKYKMVIYYSANVNSGGGTVRFNLNGNVFDHEFAQTGGWAYYVYEDIGEVELKEGGNVLELTDKEIPNTYLINVKNIVFEKID